MTNEQKQVKDWMMAAGQECPDKPTIPSLEVRKLRAKLILEEALETIKALGLHICITSEYASGYLNDETNMGIFVLDDFEEHPVCEPNLLQIADGCEDLKVVTEGTLVACGLITDSTASTAFRYRHDPLFNEVMRSNNSKFWTEEEFREHVDANINNPNWIPSTILDEHDREKIKYIVIKDLNGKVQKSPHYEPPNLQPIIEEMSK